MIVVFDMDGTIASFTGMANKRAKEIWDVDISKDEITHYKYSEVLRQKGIDLSDAEIYTKLYEGGFFNKLEPIPGAIDAIQEIFEDGHKIVICSKTFDANVIKEKFEWLEEHLGSRGIEYSTIMVSDMETKKMLNVHVLIDDDPRAVSAHPAALCLLPKQPWNRKFAEEEFAGWVLETISEAPVFVEQARKLIETEEELPF
jgi:5'(3')-deoxyribonucleotidase